MSILKTIFSFAFEKKSQRMSKKDKALIYHQRIFGLLVCYHWKKFNTIGYVEPESFICSYGRTVQNYLPRTYFESERYYTTTWRDKDFLFDFPDL